MDAFADTRRRGRSVKPRAVLWLLSIALLLLAASPAVAAPAWRIDAMSNTTVAPGGTLTYYVEVRNVGDADLNGSLESLTFTGTLSAGLTIQSAFAFNGSWDCSSIVPGMQSFSCQNADTIPPLTPGTFTSSWQTLAVTVAVDPAAAGLLTSTFEVAGGDDSDGDPSLPAASTVAPVTVTTDAPAFGIAAFDAQVAADAVGSAFTQAGGHPFSATTWVDFHTTNDPAPLRGDLTPVEAVKDVDVDLPPGFFGDPSGVDQCSLAQLANSVLFVPRALCPSTSQVGVTYVKTLGLSTHLMFGPVPVFNLVPPPDKPARLGFNVAGVVVTLDVTVRSENDYGLTAHLRNISEGLTAAGASVTLWGVPADRVHDPERACAGERAPWEGGPTCSSGAARAAFLRNPTSCTAPGVGLPTTVRADSWVDPGDFHQRTIISHLSPGYPFTPDEWGDPQGPTGCERVPFDPRLRVSPGTTAAGEPTGLSVDLTLPQNSDPDAIGQSDLRKTVLRLPVGVRLSASAARNLVGCTPAQVGLHSTAAAACPGESKLGSVSIKVPALPDPLEGSVYLAGPHDNPFDTLVALYLVARGSGVTVKLPARVDLDPISGQMTTTIDNAPQAPFSSVHVELDGGPRAPIANPGTCGTYTTQAELTSWSGKVVALSSSFTITKDGNGAPCTGAQFSPGFTAGTESNSAGSTAPLHVRITRDDQDQEIGKLDLRTPEGLLGYISKVTLCGNAQAAAGTCPESSKVGSVTTGAGAGPNPFFITNGRAYLTGPYKGAPYGLAVVVPAVAGPFDLGNVVVRSAIFVDKHNATLRVVSDSFPTMLQGVTLLVRDVRVAVDKPGFTLNPTSCAVKRIRGTITSAQGITAPVSQRFQAAECRGLGFRPRMVLTVGGRGHTRRGQTSPLSTTLTMPRRDQANLRLVRVTLPTTINARLNTINDACTRAEFESDLRKCAHAKAGTAVASTPLLRDPLRGTVFFVRNGRPIPDLFVALRGEVDFDLIGRVTIPGGKHLATTFAAAPDVPVRSFTLRLLGGPRTASIGAAANLCSPRSRRQKAKLDYIGQNGKTRHINQTLKIKGCARSGRHRRR